MKKFTVSRISGFGDYASTIGVVSNILGEDYEFVVSKSHKYINYHSPDTDFIELFYTGDILEFKDVQFISLKI